MMRSRRFRPQRPRAASGTSMVEAVVVIAVAAVLLGLTLTTIHLLLRADRDAGGALRRGLTVSRLSRRWRNDVHAARAAEIAPLGEARGARLILTAETERSVVYRIDEHQLTRVERRDEDVHSREVYYLPPGSTLRFERAESPPELLRLVVQLASRPVAALRRRGAESGGRGSADLPVEALLGRDRRFAGAMNNER